MRVSAWDKQVPSAHLLSSIDDRWSLLQGLLDTDGWVEKGGGRFLSTSEVLRDQVAWLARSLGLRVNTYDKATAHRPAYQASIQYHPNLFFLERKKSALRAPERTFHRVIKSIEPVGEQEAQCISIAADDGVFLVEDFVPTHNSTIGKSLSVTKAMWEKVCRQAKPYEIPIMPLRFYGDERLTRVDADLVVIEARVLGDLQGDANEVVAMREAKEHAEAEAADAEVPIRLLGNAMMCPQCGDIVRTQIRRCGRHPEATTVPVHVEMGHT